MNKIITIGREFGSGGREIGRRLAEHLHFAYYDQEIVKEIAKRTDMAEEYIRNIEERQPIPLLPITIERTFTLPANARSNLSVSVHGAIRSKPCNFSDFRRYPQSAYVLYASIVCLVNR